MKRLSNLVSVIIPCYNHGGFVNGAIDCIRKQTYKDVEIIVVDDGSSDNHTRDILTSIQSPDVQIYFKENGDVASARNYGIKRSNGHYILTLDADDRFHPTFLEKAVDILKSNKQVGMVTSYITRIYRDRETEVEKIGGDISTFIKNHESSASLLFRYQCWREVGGYDEEICGFEDWEFAINVTKRGWTVYSIPEYLFYYRSIDNESMYNRVIQKRPEIIQYMVHKHKDVYQDYIDHIIYEREEEIKELKETVDLHKNSIAFKIGNFILAPFKWLKKAKKKSVKGTKEVKPQTYSIPANKTYHSGNHQSKESSSNIVQNNS